MRSTTAYVERQIASANNTAHATLDGLRVIDLTRVLAGPFCAMLLGDMGADVIKVEEPREGDDARMWAPFVGAWSAYFLGVNRSKRSLALDLKGAEGSTTLRGLLKHADVFIENFKPGSLEKLGFGFDDMRALNPRLIYCSITGYGKTGPRRHLTGYDPIVQAESGFMEMTGTPDGPAVRTGWPPPITSRALAFGGPAGAARAGSDQQRPARRLAVTTRSSRRCRCRRASSSNRRGAETPRHDHSSSRRTKSALPRRHADDCRGEWGLWKQLCAAIERPDLPDDPRFSTNTARVRNRPALKQEIESAFASFTVDALVDRLTAFGVPCGRVRTVSQALADPQVDPRQMFIPFDDRARRLSRARQSDSICRGVPPTFRGAAKLGEHGE